MLIPTKEKITSENPLPCTQKRKKLTGQRCQCAACGEFFRKVRAFEGHRVGKFGWKKVKNNRRCLTPKEMKEKGMAKDSLDFWLLPASEEEKERLKGIWKK